MAEGSGSSGSPLPPCALRPVPAVGASRCSASTPRPTDASPPGDPLSRFDLLQGVPGASCPPPLGGASPGIPVPFSAIGRSGYSPEDPPSGTAHVYGFSPSSRASFRSDLSGLVSSRKHSWGSPFRGFPSDVAPAARRRRLPSCRSHGGHRSRVGVPRTALAAGWVDFRGFHIVRVRSRQRRLLRRRRGRSPPGLLPS